MTNEKKVFNRRKENMEKLSQLRQQLQAGLVEYCKELGCHNMGRWTISWHTSLLSERQMATRRCSTCDETEVREVCSQCGVIDSLETPVVYYDKDMLQYRCSKCS